MKRTSKHLIAFAGVILIGIFFTGCGNGTPKLSAKEKALFESSTPEIKQLFEKALEADKAGDYVSAYTNYQALMVQQLSVDQVIAMQTALRSLTERIYNAADKRDAKAEAAVEYLKKTNSRPGH